MEEDKRKRGDKPEEKHVLAVTCADIHAWLKPPVARSEEPNWAKAIARPINQLQQLCEDHHCPLIIAGDIFDGWKAPPELVNWMIHKLTYAFPYDTIAVAGNHDLPLHNYQDIKKSAYWTLVEAKAIINLEPAKERVVGLGDGRPMLSLTGFPCGTDTESYSEPSHGNGLVKVAVVHDYCYDKDSYPGVDGSKHYEKHRECLEGFDVAVFGDNHKPFLKANFKPYIINSGCLVRRKSDEKDQKVYAGLIYSTGDVSRVELDTSKDAWCEVNPTTVLSKGMVDLSKFVEELDQMGDHAVNFLEAVIRSLDDKKVREEVRNLVLKVLEEGK